jgi:hypothetical protein
VNGASWISTKSRLAEQVVVGTEVVDVWEGRIYGLTALSSYHCEFVRGEDVIYDASIITQSAPSTESGKSSCCIRGEEALIVNLAAIVPPTTQTLLPSSPTTTLRNSIYTAEVEAEKSKTNLRTARKQHKSAVERLQSQIDREKSKLAGNGGSDDRQRQRAKQLENSIIKIKADHDEVEGALQDLGKIPKEEKTRHRKYKEEAHQRRKGMDARRLSFERSKRETDKGVVNVKAEIDAILHKRARFEARQKEYAAKLAEAEKTKIHATQAKSARGMERVELAERRRHQQSHLESVINELERQMGEEIKKQTVSGQAISQFEDWARRLQNGGSAPGTPEGKSLLPAFSSAPLNSAGLTGALGSSSLPGSRPTSLHVSGFTPGFQFPSPIGHSSGLHSRKRASSLETEEFPNLYHSPYSTSAAVPLGFAAFTPASSMAMLPTSSPFVPLSNGHSHHPGLSNGYSSYNSSAVPLPVGAEKQSRRKHSAGSNRSISGSNGSGHASPHFSKVSAGTDMNGSGRGGLVSPPESTVWDWKPDGGKREQP